MNLFITSVEMGTDSSSLAALILPLIYLSIIVGVAVIFILMMTRKGRQLRKKANKKKQTMLNTIG